VGGCRDDALRNESMSHVRAGTFPRVFVGGHPDLPAGGQEEDPMAVTQRDLIR
jgi:hypothetical protein